MNESPVRPKKRRKRHLFTGTVVAAFIAAVVGGSLVKAPAARADGTTVEGNVNCPAGFDELRVNNPGDGTFSANGFSVTIDVRTLTTDDPGHAGDQTGSQVFDFTATGGTVLAVFVKGGPDTQFYSYGTTGTTSGTGLHAPVNPSNNLFYGLSHISFCYEVTVTPPPPP